MNHYFDALKKYATFSGRATRPQFWYFVLFNFLFSILFAVIDTAAGLQYATPNGGGGILNTLYSLAVFIPSLAVSARRMHDIGRSGWWILIALIPIIGWIWFIVLAATPTK